MSPAAGASARRAGHDFERALARRWGVATTRNTRPGAHDDGGDLLLPGWYVEAKAISPRKKPDGTEYPHPSWQLGEWFEKAERQAVEGQDVALVLKRRRMSEGDALVVVTLDTFDRLRGATP